MHPRNRWITARRSIASMIDARIGGVEGLDARLGAPLHRYQPHERLTLRSRGDALTAPMSPTAMRMFI